MVSTKKACISSLDYVFYILLRETIPIYFCWLTCRKQKLMQIKTLQQGLFNLISRFWQFCPLLNVCFNDTQINRWLHLLRKLWGIPICCGLFRKRMDKKIPFHSNKELNCISCSKVCKIFFCSEFPVNPEKQWIKEEEERQLRSVLLFKKKQ